MKTRFNAKIKELFAQVKIVNNLARQKFVFRFLLGLIKSRRVQFSEIAPHLNEEIQSGCHEVRIQDFFRQVSLGYEQVAVLVCLFLNSKGKVRLCIDRTEWDFGKCQGQYLNGTSRPGSGAGATLLGAIGQQERQLGRPRADRFSGQVPDSTG
jgi:hypothetical protein